MFAQLLLGFTGSPELNGCGGCPPTPVVPPGPIGSTGLGLDARPNNATCVAVARPVPSTGVQLQTQMTGLHFDSLTQAARAQFAPGEPYHWLMVEKAGLVKLVKDDAPDSALSFLSVGQVKSDCYECGLLGLAVDPAFTSNRRVYVSYTSETGCGAGVAMCSRLSRFVVTPNAARTSFQASSEELLLKFDQPYDNHNGGGVAFGPDGMLYASFGDGGSYFDSLGNAQNKNVCLGKLLRLNVSGSSGYSAPADNPFVASCPAGNACCPLVWAYGLRNPWRIAFDRTTGALWAGDVGQDDYEEVNRIEKGGNYGWNCFEATHAIKSDGVCAGITGSKAPVVEYSNDVGNRQSITGGYVYRGSAVDALKGKYVFGDFGSREIWAIDHAATGPILEPTPLITSDANISTFAEDEKGELYVLNLYGGQGSQFYKIIAGSGGGAGFPAALSQTGCFQGSTPASGLIPFDVNSPLWSDGASKRRFFALPNGKTIHIESDGDFSFPIGTVLAKEFALGATRVETRLFMRHSDGGWAGYSYRWNAAGSDAFLLEGRDEAIVNGVPWTFPSRGDCLSCHTQAAGDSLGLELAQLNRAQYYASTGRTAPQLQTLAGIGLFDVALPSALPALANPHDASAPAALRARAYLHANCSGCHRSGALAPPNFHYSTPFAGMGICNALPQRGDLGIADARLFAPGVPAKSIISARMHASDGVRMPSVGSYLVDTTGTALVDTWISDTNACP